MIEENYVMERSISEQPTIRLVRPSRIANYAAKQAESIHLMLALAQIAVRLIPYGAFGNVRSAIYRWIGFKKISRKVYIAGMLDLRGDGDIYSRLHIGEHTYINTPCFIEVNAEVHIGRGVGIGHHTVLITSNHEIDPSTTRMGSLRQEPLLIGDGAWLGACVTLMPGVTIGAGSVIMGGSVVTKDVPANAKVIGNPARVIGWMDEGPN